MPRTVVPNRSHTATRRRPLSWHLRLAAETFVMALFVIAIAAAPVAKLILHRLARAVAQRTGSRGLALQRNAD